MPICLAMIVRDEAKIIARCLTAAKPYVDRAVIVDTGSTDDTSTIAARTLRKLKIPGAVIQARWSGFGAARTRAFAEARAFVRQVDKQLARWHALVIDADETVSGELPRELTADAYGIWVKTNNVRYKMLRLFRLDHVWRYVGVLHEFPATGGVWSDAMLESFQIDPNRRDGARSNDPAKYAQDAAVLERALEDETDEPLRTRYTFYLAQSYRDAGDHESAARWYLRRAEMGAGLNWEEVYVALLEAGRALERLGRFKDAEATLLRAHHQWPARPEAPRELARIFNEKAAHARPVGALFVEA